MECLNEIIGLMSKDCECITDGLTQEERKEITTSKSGLFIDADLNGAINLRSMNSASACKNMINYFRDARSSAVKKFNEDVMAGLLVKYTEQGDNYFGTLGSSAYVGSLEVNEKYQFFKLQANGSSDAVIYLKNIKFALDKPTAVNVSIIRIAGNEFIGEVIDTRTFQTKGRGVENFEWIKDLPITNNGKTYDYFIVWERPDGVFPLDVKADCNCGGSRAYEKYISISGGEVPSLSDLKNAKGSIFSHGVLLDVEIVCQGLKLICREYNNRNAISVIMGWALLYKTAANILDAVLMSDNIDRYTTMNREAMYGKRNHFNSEYKLRVQHLTETMNVNSSDCFICNSNRMRIGMLTT